MAIVKATGVDYKQLKQIMQEVLIFDHDRGICEAMEYQGSAEVRGHQIMAFKVDIKNSDLLFGTLHDELHSGTSARNFVFRVALNKNDIKKGMNIGELDIFLPHSVFSGKTQHKHNETTTSEFYGMLYVSEESAFMMEAEESLVDELNAATYAVETPVNLALDTRSEHPQQLGHDGPRPTISIEQILVTNILNRELGYAPAKHRKLISNHIDLLSEFAVDLNRKTSQSWHTVLSKGLEIINGGSRNLVDRLMNIPNVTLSTFCKNAAAHVAAETGASSLVSWLEHGAEIDSRFKDGRTLLMSAATKDKVFQMWQLLSLNADAEALDAHGNSVLHYMAKYFQNAMMKDTLKNIQMTSSEMAQRFAELGASVGKNSQGETPMTITNCWGQERQNQFRELMEPFVTADRLKINVEAIPLNNSAVQRIRL